jgi:hypothetical protein
MMNATYLLDRRATNLGLEHPVHEQYLSVRSQELRGQGFVINKHKERLVFLHKRLISAQNNVSRLLAT